MNVDELLEGLTEPQREAVTHAAGPLLVLAGPGSGKTRVITHRAAYLARTVTRPWHVLAITFTNKAANEMAERLARLTAGTAPADPEVGRYGLGGLTCSTFHAFCARLLRIHADRAGLLPNYTIFDESDQTAAMKQAIDRVGLRTENFPPAKVLTRISRAKNDMIDAERYAADARDWEQKGVARIFQTYQDVLAEQNALDFDDLLVRTAKLLGDDPELRGQLEDRYRYVLVDEYQDTNHAQYLIARGLALTHENLCVTGDPDQSIYAWRGANVHNILQFEEDFPDAKVIRLEQNYRSTPQILAAADAVIAHNRKRKKKRLWTQNAEGSAVRVAQCEDPTAEAAFIASEIRRHVEAGGRYGDAAVFYRVNALSRSIEAAMRSMQIPYQVARGVAFYQRKEIKDVVAYLKVVSNPRDQVSLLRIINTPARGIGKTTVQRLIAYAESTGRTPLDTITDADAIPDVGRAAASALKGFAALIDDLRRIAERGEVRDVIEHTVHHSGLRAAWEQADDANAVENAEELINAGAEYDRQHPDGGGSVTDWLQQVSLISDVDAIDEAVGAVTLMTLHAAKGLEFDTVFIAGVEHGLLPHQRSEQSRAELEEERRLCFVGMTRAERRLTLTFARWRDFRGVSQRSSRSVFLKELPKEGVERLTVGEAGASGYDAGGAADDPVADDFADWRQGQFVRHAEYGLGRVMWIQPASQKTRAGIRFEHVGEKTMILEYSGLERVEPDELD